MGIFSILVMIMTYMKQFVEPAYLFGEVMVEIWGFLGDAIKLLQYFI